MRFFQHFWRLIKDNWHDELTTNFKETQHTLSLLPIEILKHASTICTPIAFRIFEAKLCKAYDSGMTIHSEIETKIEYKTTPHGKHFHHTIKYESSIGLGTCSCKKYNFTGILCSHILKDLSSWNLKRVPSQYIFKRWIKYSKMRISTTSRCKSTSIRDAYSKELCRLLTKRATKATKTK